jgi:uncharacterized protein (UPF0212 family)
MIEVQIRRPCSEKLTFTDLASGYQICAECGGVGGSLFSPIKHALVTEWVSFAEAERLAHSEEAKGEK